MSNIEQIKNHLEQLLLQAKEQDKTRSKSTKPLFDRTLFKCRARYLLPCVKEAISTYRDIHAEHTRSTKNLERVDHLSARLLNQINAIQRELATFQLRDAELSGYIQKQSPLKTLYQELMQHCEWERRLAEMAGEKEKAWNLASKQNKARAKKLFILTEQRLIRCQKAKLAIETEIGRREKNND